MHISALSNNFIDDRGQSGEGGDVVKVKVLEVDVPRKRIALTMRLDDEVGTAARSSGAPRSEPRRQGGRPQQAPADLGGGAMAAAFAKLKKS